MEKENEAENHSTPSASLLPISQSPSFTASSTLLPAPEGAGGFLFQAGVIPELTPHPGPQNPFRWKCPPLVWVPLLPSPQRARFLTFSCPAPFSLVTLLDFPKLRALPFHVLCPLVQAHPLPCLLVCVFASVPPRIILWSLLFPRFPSHLCLWRCVYDSAILATGEGQGCVQWVVRMSGMSSPPASVPYT